jgi:hypothetical protein
MPSFKSLLLVAVLATIGFFAWENLKTPPPKIVTPEEDVAICMGKNPIPAEELVKIAEKHPKLLATALKNRRISVSGILKKALVKGVGSYDLTLDLQGDDKTYVSFSSDVNRPLTKGIVEHCKFYKQGREILVKQITQKTGRVDSIVPTTSQEPLMPNILNAIQPKKPAVAQSPSGDTILFRELDSVKLDGIFQYITKGSIKMEWTPPMSF